MKSVVYCIGFYFVLVTRLIKNSCQDWYLSANILIFGFQIQRDISICQHVRIGTSLVNFDFAMHCWASVMLFECFLLILCSRQSNIIVCPQLVAYKETLSVQEHEKTIKQPRQLLLGDLKDNCCEHLSISSSRSVFTACTSLHLLKKFRSDWFEYLWSELETHDEKENRILIRIWMHARNWVYKKYKIGKWKMKTSLYVDTHEWATQT